MDNFNQLFPKNLYHSYVIEGNPKEVSSFLLIFLENKGEINKNNQDLFINLYDSFTIQDSNNIKDWHKNKPIDSGKKICIIGANFINQEAQQSLLKIIEEPGENTYFFIIVPNSSLLLKTILSRVHLIKNLKRDINLKHNYALEFISKNTNERIEEIALIINEFKDNKNSGGLRHKAILLINDIEIIIYKKWKLDLKNYNYKFMLDELKKNRDFLNTPGASVKMILEHIALMI